MRRALAGLLTLGALALAFSSWNATRTVVCLGDSNTAAAPSWCDMLQVLLPGRGWRFVNRAQAYAVSSHPEEFPLNGRSQLMRSLAADGGDAVILAFGTNDLLLGFAVADGLGVSMDGSLLDRVVDNYLSLRKVARDAGRRTFVASTPPLATQNRPFYEPVNPLVAELNRRLREAFSPAELIDFDSTMDEATDYRDAYHLNVVGQAKRAVAACKTLARAYEPERVGACEDRVPLLRATIDGGELREIRRVSRKRRSREIFRRRPVRARAASELIGHLRGASETATDPSLLGPLVQEGSRLFSPNESRVLSFEEDLSAERNLTPLDPALMAPETSP